MTPWGTRTAFLELRRLEVVWLVEKVRPRGRRELGLWRVALADDSDQRQKT